MRRSFIWTCRGSVIIVISSIWCFFFFLCRLLFLSSTQIRCGAVCQERKGHWKKLKQNKTTIWIWHLLQAASFFFFFALLVYKKKKKNSNNKKKKTNDLSETRMHDTNKQTLLQQLDISVAYMCDFLHCVAKGFPPKSHYWSFFFFLRFPFRSSTPRQSGRPISRWVACSSNNHKWANNKQSNKWQKTNKQTNKKHASTRK